MSLKLGAHSGKICDDSQLPSHGWYYSGDHEKKTGVLFPPVAPESRQSVWVLEPAPPGSNPVTSAALGTFEPSLLYFLHL